MFALNDNTFIIIQDSLSTQRTQWKDSGVEKNFLSAVSQSQISSPLDLNPSVRDLENLQDFIFCLKICFY